MRIIAMLAVASTLAVGCGDNDGAAGGEGKGEGEGEGAEGEGEGAEGEGEGGQSPCGPYEPFDCTALCARNGDCSPTLDLVACTERCDQGITYLSDEATAGLRECVSTTTCDRVEALLEDLPDLYRHCLERLPCWGEVHPLAEAMCRGAVQAGELPDLESCYGLPVWDDLRCQDVCFTRDAIMCVEEAGNDGDAAGDCLSFPRPTPPDRGDGLRCGYVQAVRAPEDRCALNLAECNDGREYRLECSPQDGIVPCTCHKNGEVAGECTLAAHVERAPYGVCTRGAFHDCCDIRLH